ncbi:MAG: hypothetical protein GXO77_02645 [Calditrichaeota bacterium]|nr:hypothetical protein [Calditrichota bacterium]
MNRLVKKEVNEIFQNAAVSKEVIKSEDIAGLPEPVRRWLKYSNIIGKERIRVVRLKQKGFFRTGPDKKWMPFDAREYYTTDPPAFIWSATVRMAPLVPLKVRDKYAEGKGKMQVKLLGLFSVVDETGDEIDQGAMVRYLNEMMWFPSAALNDYIKWEPVDDNSAKATMSYQGVTASAIFYFDEEGKVTNMIAERAMYEDNAFVFKKWSTPITEHGELNGIRIPVKGEGVWLLESGDFSYIRLEVTDIEYNVPSLY